MSRKQKICKSEAIACIASTFNIKRKVFYGDGTVKNFKEMLLKYKKLVRYCLSAVVEQRYSNYWENDFEFKTVLIKRSLRIYLNLMSQIMT